MRILFLITLVLFPLALCSQKYVTKTGNISFEASVPSFEPVQATNTTTTAILEVSNGKLAVLTLIKGFRFKNALMEEHFNENYMDSSKFPKATFSGNLVNFDWDAEWGKKEYVANGNLTVHGVTKPVKLAIILTRENEGVSLTTEFQANPEDFDIEIPGLVKEKISDTINVSASLKLKER